jgi:hypothetical protein
MRELPHRRRAPYLHHDGCPAQDDLQVDRFLAEMRSGDTGGPPLYCADPAHDHRLRIACTLGG